ncbi:melatonin receptor type 1B-like [Protopterus annectens]|uniref:melatonin receptor type 1B-like n=1 Tax=Protopterus annectens TaxID=7888 RepID=UPI001CF9811D|nr:melatonin receptor type 1B-like [Protopterus annectens]
MSKFLINCSDCEVQVVNESDLASHSSSKAKTIGMATALVFITIADLIGNSLVILSVLRNKKLRNTGNIFVINLSFTDLLTVFYSYPLIIMAIIKNDWTVGDIHCQITGYILVFSLLASVYNIMAIAINRYFYICHSTKYDKLYSTWNTVFWLCFVWAMAVIALLPIATVGALRYEEQIYTCEFIQTINLASAITVAVLHYIIPMTIIIFCYVRIWTLVIKVKYRVRKDGKQKLKPAEIKSFLTMFIVFVLFAICWSPFHISSLVMGLSPPGKAPRIISWLYVTSYFMMFFNSCLNGIIYGLFNQNFREEFKNILLLLWLPGIFCKETSRRRTNSEKTSSLSQMISVTSHIRKSIG